MPTLEKTLAAAKSPQDRSLRGIADALHGARLLHEVTADAEDAMVLQGVNTLEEYQRYLDRRS